MPNTIRIAILDDHASIIDGYKFRLSEAPDCEVVATATYGAELEPMLAQGGIDVLLLDITVPVSAEDDSTYPMVDKLPEIVRKHPGTRVLVISMHKQSYLIQHALDVGTAGFVLKDDMEVTRKLDEVIRQVNAGSIFVSEAARELIDSPNKKIITPRQLEVLNYFANDPSLSTSKVAEELHIAHSTVRNLLSTTYAKLGVRNLPAAIEEARKKGLITPQSPEHQE
ncbi:MAG: DNA-binding response regulator [Chloroflexi bacterium]|nr:MAG: DNA-binding response regulator [Chloroflexota bacterium]MBL1193952.1 DNA-binding response regulator [Chloroflexota bacterium]NOH11247.1 response regulator transcription factor [Chloroflexota bacterium]